MRARSIGAGLLLTLACGGDDGPMNVSDATTTGGVATTTSGSTAAGVDDSTGAASDTGASTGSDTTGAIDHGALRLVELVPTEHVLEIDLQTPGMLTYEVRGLYEDGTWRSLTDTASLSLADPTLGTLDGATFEAVPHAETFVGSTTITATVAGHRAQAQLTVAAYAKTGASPSFFFVLPYLEPAGALEAPLTFSTDNERLDVLINMDVTASMEAPIGNLQSTLVGGVIPGIDAAVPDAWFGAAAFMDFPVLPFGLEGCDQPFALLQAMSPTVADTEDAVGAYTPAADKTLGCGGDLPESHIEALYQIATGQGLDGPGATFVAPGGVGIGGAGFRESALPVVVSITDALSHDPGAPLCGFGDDYEIDPTVMAVAATREQTMLALEQICARVVTLAVNYHDEYCGPLADGVAFAEATGAVIPPEAWDFAPGGRPLGCAPGQCCTGIQGIGAAPNGEGMCPLAYRVPGDGTGVGSSMADGVVMLARYAPRSVTTSVSGTTTDVEGNALPPGMTTADFILSVTPLWYGPLPLPGVDPPMITADGFVGVIPNTPVTFEVQAFNGLVVPTDDPQLFTATITVVADDCGSLDEREVLILVPPPGPTPPR